MQKLLFSGLLGSNAPEATPKFYSLHPKVRMKVSHYFPFLGLEILEFSHKFDRNK